MYQERLNAIYPKLQKVCNYILLAEEFIDDDKFKQNADDFITSLECLVNKYKG